MILIFKQFLYLYSLLSSKSVIDNSEPKNLQNTKYFFVTTTYFTTIGL